MYNGFAMYNGFTKEDVNFIKENTVYLWLNIQIESIYGASKILLHTPVETALNDFFKVIETYNIETYNIVDKDVLYIISCI